MQEFALRGTDRGAPDGALEALQGTPFEGRCGMTLCDVLHPHRRTCDAHAVDVFPGAFWRSVAVYTPVYAASMVAVQRAELLKRPVDLLVRAAAGAARSSLFLSLYIVFAHRGARLQPPHACATRLALGIPLASRPTCSSCRQTAAAPVCIGHSFAHARAPPRSHLLPS